LQEDRLEAIQRREFEESRLSKLIDEELSSKIERTEGVTKRGLLEAIGSKSAGGRILNGCLNLRFMRYIPIVIYLSKSVVKSKREEYKKELVWRIYKIAEEVYVNSSRYKK
jgi:hypothetical protein